MNRKGLFIILKIEWNTIVITIILLFISNPGSQFSQNQKEHFEYNHILLRLVWDRNPKASVFRRY